MSDFMNASDKAGFHFRLWRGERMNMLGFDVEEPEDDFVGFAIEVKSPHSDGYEYLRNRLNFSYLPAGAGVTGDRQFSTLEAPIQKFRWIHFPWQPTDGTYSYRVTKMHMPKKDHLVQGTSLTLGIEQRAITYDGIVDVGFTRNFASSQAYREQFGNREDIIPTDSAKGLSFEMVDLKNDRGESVYDWLGFEARALLHQFIADVENDPKLTLDFFAYDLNLPDMVERLEGVAGRMRAVIDDSAEHGKPSSAESKSAKRLKAAGAKVTRTHFHGLQHNKVLIQRRNGKPVKVLCGSTNFTFRGLYIQANNVLVFDSDSVAGYFGKMFDMAFADPASYRNSPFAAKWHVATHKNGPTVQLCFSPHKVSKKDGDGTNLSLNPIASALDQATTSAFYSLAFLNMMKSGPTFESFNRVMKRPIFSCGSVDSRGELELVKPDGSRGVVDFKYLAKLAPKPFDKEWSGGKGRNVHHKFLVTDFNLPTAKVFTGSSNFSPSGENKNGDHLIMIEDQKIATAYAIEAMRVFDHLQFRNWMNDKEKGEKVKALTLRKPVKLGGKTEWFGKYYVDGSQAMRDRLLFSRSPNDVKNLID
jgi:phosphatidylserine/phosphatidylglycerophosphate/cardiolipin synthase-like enzyme